MSVPAARLEYVVAVLGATGLVGQTMIAVLEGRNFPVRTLLPLATRGDGRTVRFRGEEIPVQAVRPESFDGVDIALFSAGGAASAAYAPQAASRGCVVVDNSSAWRMDATVPLVVSQVNPDALATHNGIVANPNCSTMQLAPILKALDDAVGLRRVVVATYQAVSGAGGRAIADLRQQRESLVGGREAVSTLYPHAVASSPIPAIDVFLDDGSTREETKVVHESRKILGRPALRIAATAVRVPVERSHSEAVHVELGAPMTPATARQLFGRVEGVTVIDNPAAQAYPLAAHAAGSDEIYVGRVRADLSVPNGLAFWVVSDNVRKGAATNAVQIAELLVARGLVHGARRHD